MTKNKKEGPCFLVTWLNHEHAQREGEDLACCAVTASGNYCRGGKVLVQVWEESKEYNIVIGKNQRSTT